jgi:hypothetical protein
MPRRGTIRTVNARRIASSDDPGPRWSAMASAGPATAAARGPDPVTGESAER